MSALCIEQSFESTLNARLWFLPISEGLEWLAR
jgi:hypothetical protein